MENRDLFDFIESFLDKTLPEEQRKEVEQRIAKDEDFRREVQLHRELQQNFNDPGRWHLRSTLVKVMNEPASIEQPIESKPAVTHKYWKWYIMLAAVFIMIGFWYWLKPSEGESLQDPIEALPPVESSSPQANSEPDSVVTETHKEIISGKQQPEEPLQIAQADPADFVPNPSMEAFVNSTFRSQHDLSITMNSPVNSAAFTPNSTGEAEVLFTGKVTGLPKDSPITLVLNVFNNEDVSKPLIGLPFDLIKNDTAGWMFEVQQQLKFPLGLYYFTIDHEGEMLYAGKFTIGKSKK